MKVHVGRNRGFYQAYIQDNMVQEIETSNPGKLMVSLCPLDLKRINDAGRDHCTGSTPMNGLGESYMNTRCVISGGRSMHDVSIISAPNCLQEENGDCVTGVVQIDKQHGDTRTLYTYLDNSYSKSFAESDNTES
jgi:hypothetical protein